MMLTRVPRIGYRAPKRMATYRQYRRWLAGCGARGTDWRETASARVSDLVSQSREFGLNVCNSRIEEMIRPWSDAVPLHYEEPYKSRQGVSRSGFEITQEAVSQLVLMLWSQYNIWVWTGRILSQSLIANGAKNMWKWTRRAVRYLGDALDWKSKNGKFQK